MNMAEWINIGLTTLSQHYDIQTDVRMHDAPYNDSWPSLLTAQAVTLQSSVAGWIVFGFKSNEKHKK